MEIVAIVYVAVIYVICLIAIVCSCNKMAWMGRKRKIQDVESGLLEGERKIKRRRTRQSEVNNWDTFTFSLEPKGIPNTGATCFMNSILQCLSWSPHFIQQLQRQIEKGWLHNNKANLAKALQQLLQRNRTQYGIESEPQKEREAIAEAQMMSQMQLVRHFCKEMAKQNDTFNGRTQQDSFEFFTTLLSDLEDEALENCPFQPEGSATLTEHVMCTCDVTRLFGGSFVTLLCYKQCGHVEPVFQRFTSLSLPLVVNKKSEKVKKSRYRDFKKEEGPTLNRPTRVSDENTNIMDKRSSVYRSYGPTVFHSQVIDHATPLRFHDTLPHLKLTRPSCRRLVVPYESDCRTRETYSNQPQGVCYDDGMESRTEVNQPSTQTNEDLQAKYPDDARRLYNMRLGKSKKKCKRTGLELGLDKWAQMEKMMADDIPCRTCNDQKGGNGGVVFKHNKIVALPSTLVLHINRFEQTGRRLSKASDFISYPKILDMTSYCCRALEQTEPEPHHDKGPQKKYSLFGVVNHRGTMAGGHYTVYIKTKPRDVGIIQNLLRNSWKDPETIASRIQSQLEGIWQEGRNFHPTGEKLRKLNEDSVNSTKTDPSREDPVDDQNSSLTNDPNDQQASSEIEGQDPRTPTARECSGHLGPDNQKHPSDQSSPECLNVLSDQQISGITPRNNLHASQDNCPQNEYGLQGHDLSKYTCDKECSSEHLREGPEKEKTESFYNHDSKQSQHADDDCQRMIKQEKHIQHNQKDSSTDNDLEEDGAIANVKEKGDECPENDGKAPLLGENMNPVVRMERLSEARIAAWSDPKREMMERENALSGHRKERYDPHQDECESLQDKIEADNSEENMKDNLGRHDDIILVGKSNPEYQMEEYIDGFPDGNKVDQGQKTNNDIDTGVDMDGDDNFSYLYEVYFTPEQDTYGSVRQGSGELAVDARYNSLNRNHGSNCGNEDEPPKTEFNADGDEDDAPMKNNGYDQSRKTDNKDENAEANIEEGQMLEENPERESKEWNETRGDSTSDSRYDTYGDGDKDFSGDSEWGNTAAEWYYINDSLVLPEEESTVLSSQSAYILMYERI
ncbi:uncharacterized protein [Argopecten irradians]|uniref:uncharacterized protein isoform X2 n=1 Tax=Argopecten irradians TaxID=31199 RepID=UPI0037241D36